MQNLCDRSPPYVCVVGGLGGPEKPSICVARDPSDMEEAAQPARPLFRIFAIFRLKKRASMAQGQRLIQDGVWFLLQRKMA